jgi:polysaccharide biosynthesis protein PslG
MRPMRRLLPIAAVVALLASLTACGGADPDRIGLSTHLKLSEEPIDRQVARLADEGVRWIREDFVWAEIEPEDGRFDWSRTDAVVSAAARHEVHVLPILGYAPGWASGDPTGDIFQPPHDPSRYARFAREVVERYGAGGDFWRSRPDLPERPLREVELWNEPWAHQFWKPDPDPAAYARLARAAAEAVDSAEPQVGVLMSADLLQVRSDGSTRDWFEELLRADPDLPELVDAWSIHTYPSPRDRAPWEHSGDRRFDVDRIGQTARIAKSHDASRPIWITEVGWSTAAAADETVTEEEQAQYLDATLDRALGDWRDAVARTFVYSWDRSSEDPGDREGAYGLRRADGSFKPAWDEVAARLR